MTHMPIFDSPDPPADGAGTTLGWYDVRDHGFVSGGSTDNTAALRTLVTTVLTAGGGTIYYPAGKWMHSVGAPGARDIVPLSNKGDMRLRFVGDGRASEIYWGGDAGASDAHFFSVENNSRFLEFENLRIVHKNFTSTNPSEQHHFLNLATAATGDVQHIYVRNCFFGVIKGDIVKCAGGIAGTACFSVGVAANAASGAFGVGQLTSPTVPQRVVANYPASWDGGSVTITGTDNNGNVISETIRALVGAGADKYIGNLYFTTITAASKSAVGATSGLLKLGFAYEVSDVVMQGCYCDGFEYEGTNPDYGYRAVFTAQRLSKDITVIDNYMTGSSDQLIDFEPTSNGEVQRWTIDRNIIISRKPKSSGNAPALAVTLFGTGNTGGDLLNFRSSFCDNIVVGRIQGGKMSNCVIARNRIYDNGNPNDVGMLAISETLDDVIVADNFIETLSTFTGRPIVITGTTGFLPNGVRISGNTVRWRDRIGMYCSDISNLQILNNRFIYQSTDTNTDSAITIEHIEGNATNLQIIGNQFRGNAGGGTLKEAIVIGPGTNTVTGCIIKDNQGLGIQTKGISMSSGTWVSFPIIDGNDFSAATTPISIAAGVVTIVSGNSGGWAFYKSSTADPNGLAALDNVELGSLYSGANGTVYRKATAGAAGWSTI